MTVKELIQELKTLDESLDVLCYDDDKSTVYDIYDISCVHAEMGKEKDDIMPRLKFGKTDTSSPVAIILVTQEP